MWLRKMTDILPCQSGFINWKIGRWSRPPATSRLSYVVQENYWYFTSSTSRLPRQPVVIQWRIDVDHVYRLKNHGYFTVPPQPVIDENALILNFLKWKFDEKHQRWKNITFWVVRELGNTLWWVCEQGTVRTSWCVLVRKREREHISLLQKNRSRIVLLVFRIPVHHLNIYECRILGICDLTWENSDLTAEWMTSSGLSHELVIK